jgi:hypothetical protein
MPETENAAGASGGARGSSTGRVDLEHSANASQKQPWALVEVLPRGRYRVLQRCASWDEAAGLLQMGGDGRTPWAVAWCGGRA